VLFILILSSAFDLVLHAVRLKKVIAFDLLDAFFGWFSISFTNWQSFVRIADVFRHLLLFCLESPSSAVVLLMTFVMSGNVLGIFSFR